MIEFTGERVIPGQVDADLWAEHVSRYAFASRFAAGARILDAGSGAGYGTAELAKQARFAVGIDLAPDAIIHARAVYPQPNIRFIPASVTALPFRDESFDLITAFEVIEHLDDWRAFLSETRRLLHPDGLFLVSTPNKEYYTESRGVAGPNPFHTHEFEFDEFHNVLAEFFPHCKILLQNHVEAFAFYQHGVDSPLAGRMDGVRGSAREGHFFLAICSIRKVPESVGFLFVHEGSNVLRERERHIRGLQQQLEDARDQFAALHHAHDDLNRELEKQNLWTLSTVEELEGKNRDLTTVLEHLNMAEATILERTEWAQKLAAEAQRLTALAQKLNAEVMDLAARLDLLRSSRWVKLGRKLNLGPDLNQSPIKGNAAGGGQ